MILVSQRSKALFDDLHIYSISQLNQDIRLILEGNFSSIWVEGEVSNFRMPRSGHFYFTLKDSLSQVRAVMFKRQNHALNFMPADGDHVLCLGRVSLYEPRGECQIIVESLELKGLGGLMRAFEQLKAKLAAEGIFEPRFKKPIPLLPRHVAVITSASGAAIRDILQVIHRRFANLTITVIPVTVQGGGAAAEIVQALKQCNRLLAGQVDTIILARGGGSWEDLAPFNEEAVALAIFSSRIPLISAVGHEVDYTIADFVADLRAPTPSAAAELVVAQRDQLVEKIKFLDQRCRQAIQNQLGSYRGRLQLCSARLSRPEILYQRLRQRVEELSYRFTRIITDRMRRLQRQVERASRSLAIRSPEYKLADCRQRLECLSGRLMRVSLQQQQNQRHSLNLLAGKLESCSPLGILRRGYAVVEKLPAQQVIIDAGKLQPGDQLLATFACGRAYCGVQEVLDDES